MVMGEAVSGEHRSHVRLGGTPNLKLRMGAPLRTNRACVPAQYHLFAPANLKKLNAMQVPAAHGRNVLGTPRCLRCAWRMAELYA